MGDGERQRAVFSKEPVGLVARRVEGSLLIFPDVIEGRRVARRIRSSAELPAQGHRLLSPFDDSFPMEELRRFFADLVKIGLMSIVQ